MTWVPNFIHKSLVVMLQDFLRAWKFFLTYTLPFSSMFSSLMLTLKVKNSPKVFTKQRRSLYEVRKIRVKFVMLPRLFLSLCFFFLQSC